MNARQMFQIRMAGQADIAVLRGMTQVLRVAKDLDYFERNFAEQEAGRRELLIVSDGGADAGYCILNWEPKYVPYKQQGIPETQDINILPAYRRRGMATALIENCEARARAKGCAVMGISVGLHGAFGPAQILYVKMGYVPDGLGITYDRRQVGAGEFKAVDDNLCLMMVKSLKT